MRVFLSKIAEKEIKINRVFKSEVKDGKFNANNHECCSVNY